MSSTKTDRLQGDIHWYVYVCRQSTPTSKLLKLLDTLFNTFQ